MKENDSRKNFLVIIYSGCTYIHQGQLFLEPHQQTEPTVQWSDYVDRRILPAVAKVLLVFDTTNLRHEHYTQMFKETGKRLDTIGYKGNRTLLSILAINGSDTKAFTSALTTAASTNPDGFKVSKLRDIMKSSHPTGNITPTAALYHIEKTGSGGVEAPRCVLLPLARPRLRMYEHHIFVDPHNEYLRNYTTIHQDGTCRVIKLSLGPDRQKFSTSSVSHVRNVPGGLRLIFHIQCIVAVKRFTIRLRSRAYLRDDFLREKDNLVEVSQWNHRHILGMLATFETKCANFETLNIVLPFAGGGNLYDFLRLEQDTRWQQRGYPTSDPSFTGCLADWRYAVFRETAGLVDAVSVLHEDRNGKFIIHCDIKPANVLIQKGTFKLADFGLSRFKDSDDSSKTEWHRGTALYSPPERDSSMGVGRARDVWALGCVLLEIAFMIRYAFQPEVVFLRSDIKNIIDDFETRRRLSSMEAGESESIIYHKTMKCVREEMRKFDTMRPGLRQRITRDGMIPAIRSMMEEDPRKRITAADAAKALKSSYLSLQGDPQLQREIEFRDNPGGPPVDWEGWNSYGPMEARQNTGIRRSTVPSPHEVGSYPRPPPPLRTATAPVGSTGATEEMDDMELQEMKRPASSDETAFHPPPITPRAPHPFDFKETASQPDTFIPKNNRRPSLMEEESAGKRRRTDAPF